MLPPAFRDTPIAHRAWHGPDAPENSRAAIRAAIAAGYGIEIDLQLSSDGTAMVFHDYALDRLTDQSGPVRQRSAAALQDIRLTGGDEGIPTLREVLALVAGQVPLLIEIKDQDGAMGDSVGPLEEATSRDLAGYDGPVAVMSFNPHSVARMAALAPQVPRGLTTCAYHADHWPTLPEARRAALRRIDAYAETGAAFISHRWTDLANPRVARLKAEGAAILCWTIRTPAEEAQARRIADNVTFEHYPA